MRTDRAVRVCRLARSWRDAAGISRLSHGGSTEQDPPYDGHSRLSHGGSTEQDPPYDGHGGSTEQNPPYDGHGGSTEQDPPYDGHGGSTEQDRPTTDTAGPQNRTRPTTDLLLSPHRASLDQYCVGCHNQNVRTAGLALDGIDVERAGDNAEVWEKVVRKLRARMMPPPGRPRPDDATFDRLVAHLETSLDRSAAGIPNPGRTDTFRRLNRTEYQNAIRDLLALEVDVASILPKDARAMALTT